MKGMPFAGLERSDFWPVLQGGWETVEGVLMPFAHALRALEAASGERLREDPELAAAEDAVDLQAFLEEKAVALALPAPDRVFYLDMARRQVRGLPPDLAAGYYAVWPLAALRASRSLGDLLGRGCPSQRFEIRQAYRLAAGAGLIAWLAVGLALVAFNAWRARS